MSTIALIVCFAVLLLALVLVRAKTGSKYEIKTSDIIVALIPVILWLLLSGRLLEIGVGDLRLKLTEAYKDSRAGEVDIAKSLVHSHYLFVGVDCRYAHEDEIQDPNKFPVFNSFELIVIEEH